MDKVIIKKNEDYYTHKLLVLVVLYKCLPSNSESIKSIISNELSENIDFKLVIWDNSPTTLPQSEFDFLSNNLKDFTYYHKPENVWLSVVYNHILNLFHFDYLLLLDQDSNLPKDYFLTFTSIKESNSDVLLFLPKIYNNDKLVSPGHFKYFKGKHLKIIKEGTLPSKGLLAISSGMIISGKYFDKCQFKFNENLSLYGVDTDFMLKFAKNEKSVFILPCKIQHSTTLWSDPPVEVMLDRFFNLKKAWGIIMKEKPLARTLSFFHYIYLSFKLAFKYKDFRFLKFLRN